MFRDRCERLCLDVGDAVDACRPDAMLWEDLGATDREDYVSQCRRDWSDLQADLTARELELAVDVCEEASDELDQLSCEEVIALYGP